MPLNFADVTPSSPLSAQAVLVLLAALGLSATTGLRAYLPLVAVGVAANVPALNGTQALPLQGPFTSLSNPGVIALFGVLAVLELILDKIPVVDHLNDLVHTVIRPLVGAVILAGTTNSLSLVSPWVAAAAGAVLALLVHTAKAGTRHAVSATTIGMGNPIVSLLEDVLVILSVVLLVSFPIVGFILTVLVLLLLWRVFRWVLRGVGRLFGKGKRAPRGTAPAGRQAALVPAGRTPAANALAAGAQPAKRGKRVRANKKVALGLGAAAIVPALPQPRIPAAGGLPAGMPGIAAGGVAPLGAAHGPGVVGRIPDAVPTTPTTPTMPTTPDADAPGFLTAGPRGQSPILPPAQTIQPPMRTAPLPPTPAAPYPEDAKTLPASYRQNPNNAKTERN